MVKMLQKTLGAGEPRVGCGISFGIRSGGCSPSRPPHSHMRRDRGLPVNIPSTADNVPRTTGNRQPPEISSSKTKQWAPPPTNAESDSSVTVKH